MKRFVTLIALFTFTATIAAASPSYNVNVDTSVRSTVLFIGDSNITKAAAAITAALTTRMDGAHLPVFGSRSGMGIRGYGPVNCPLSTYPTGCAASDYWALRIPNILQSVTPSVIVIDLGGNDVPLAGTPDGLGYSNYPAKIDWLLAQMPAGIPIIWTNLPCSIEPAPYNGPGCTAINNAILAARSRHANLIVLGWYGTSLNHPEYMGAAPHYSPAGNAAWANLVNTRLNELFP